MALVQWINKVGCVVDMIYMSQKGIITKRSIRVLSVKGDYIRAFCIDSGAQRVFLAANVLAAELVSRDVS
ncbi:hypothetical protein [Paenibacillus sinopodophylli]|uniref:hypothetical protein n=1 Tax=Paenibacillus sinopodophylli TaxID=1837342 RepID=UPI00110CA5DA|nr:hypothetical protein [Paenibacillus sinopodophylli]